MLLTEGLASTGVLPNSEDNQPCRPLVQTYYCAPPQPASRPLVQAYYPPPPIDQAPGVDCPLSESHKISQTNCHTNCHTPLLSNKKRPTKDRLKKSEKKIETGLSPFSLVLHFRVGQVVESVAGVIEDCAKGEPPEEGDGKYEV
ncbi:hypothetical protein SCRES3_gp71 [Synechococcus phage S-CRES3]|nr:hypothetical protein SCRES3_gp71 [Synechococcus phage S-CRES3]